MLLVTMMISIIRRMLTMVMRWRRRMIMKMWIISMLKITHRVSVGNEFKVHIFPFNLHFLHGLLQTKLLAGRTTYLIKSVEEQVNTIKYHSLTFYKMHILHTVLCTFPKVVTRRICQTIKSFSSCWLFPLFSGPYWVIQGGLLQGVKLTFFSLIATWLLNSSKW